MRLSKIAPHVLSGAFGSGERIDNQVEILDGTAAVTA